MSRSKNLQYLLRAPLVVLPLFIACGSGAGKPAASADDADKTEQAASADDSGTDMTATEKTDDSESAKADEKQADKKSAAKGAAEDEDDGEVAPKDDSRTTAACEKIIKDNRKAFKKCYEDVRKSKPELKGTVHLQVELDAAGKVKKAYIDEDSSIKEPKIDECMISLAKSLTYPASTKGLEKNFGYEFGFNNAQ